MEISRAEMASAAAAQSQELRGAEILVKALQAAGKPAARKMFKELTTTETAWNARGTENLIILKSW